MRLEVVPDADEVPAGINQRKLAHPPWTVRKITYRNILLLQRAVTHVCISNVEIHSGLVGRLLKAGGEPKVENLFAVVSDPRILLTVWLYFKAKTAVERKGLSHIRDWENHLGDQVERCGG